MNASLAYPGFPHFLAAAVSDLDPPDAVEAHRVARNQPAVPQISDLVVQALAHPTVDPGTVQRVRELAQGLAVAARAATLMLAVIDPSIPAGSIAAAEGLET